MSLSARMRRVVVVHEPNFDQWEKALDHAGIAAPLSIWSFTDFANNPYNERLEEAAGEADVLVIQKSLLSTLDSFANLAVRASMASAVPVERIIFEDDYRDPMAVKFQLAAEIQQESKE